MSEIKINSKPSNDDRILMLEFIKREDGDAYSIVRLEGHKERLLESRESGVTPCTREFAQRFVDALWECGIKPTQCLGDEKILEIIERNAKVIEEINKRLEQMNPPDSHSGVERKPHYNREATVARWEVELI